MKRISIFLLLALLISMFSCNKDEELPPKDDSGETPYQSKGYFPMKVGSYWIYKHYRVKPDGTDTALAAMDSVYISGTKIIRGNTYYVFEQSTYNNMLSYRRDSLGYLVDSAGNVLVSESHFEDTLISRNSQLDSNTILYHTGLIMHNSDTNITVPAGSFAHCITAEVRIKIYYGNPEPPNPFSLYNYYAPNVGLLYWEYRYSSSSTIYRVKLLRYHIP